MVVIALETLQTTKYKAVDFDEKSGNEIDTKIESCSANIRESLRFIENQIKHIVVVREPGDDREELTETEKTLRLNLMKNYSRLLADLSQRFRESQLRFQKSSIFSWFFNSMQK